MASEAVTYLCPFCGSDISSNDVLFVDESVETLYEDTVRLQFLTNCCKDWMAGQGKEFRGLFFRVTGENVTKRDQRGFPIELSVLRSEGLTPTEINGDPPLPGEMKPEDTGFKRKISTRVCPKCHCRLPQNFGIIPTIYVTMMGGRAAGKTAYLLSLVHRLNAQLSSLNLGTTMLLEESKNYYEFQNDYYQKHKGVTMPTPKDELLFPFIFEYSNLNSATPKSCFVAIYDLAGEGVTSTDYLLNHRGVQIAKTVLLMLDPNQLNGGMYASQLQIAKQTTGDTPTDGTAVHDTYNEWISDFLTQSVLSNRAHGILTNVNHVVAVTTKIDQPMMCKPDLFGGHCVLTEDIGQAHRERLNMQVIQEISSFLQRFFQSEGHGIDIVNTISTVFSTGKKLRVDLLAVSTWTRKMASSKPIEFSNEYQEFAPKHRVAEPFLVILARAGMIASEGIVELSDEAKEIQQQIDALKRELEILRTRLKRGGLFTGRTQRKINDLENRIDRLEDKKAEILKND